MEKELASLVKENYLNLVVGSMQVDAGYFVLLFSQRMNKEVSIIVSGNHDRVEILRKFNRILETV